MTEISSIAQRLLQFSPDALLVVDSHGIIRFANDTSGAMFGHSPERLIGQPVTRLIPDRFHTRHDVYVAKYLLEPGRREMGARIRDLFALRADNSEFPAGIRLSPFTDGGEGFVAVAIRDMTERRSISDALVAAREEADRANRAKSRFLAIASHDLRQPLQAIRLINASMQKLTEHNSDWRELLRHQEVAIDGASRLLNTLLDIGRLESGAVDPQLAPLDLACAFADLAQEFKAAAAVRKLRLEFPETEIVLSTDPILFMQLLQNLIDNALKYTADGHVTISQESEADALLLKIEDSGLGIPAEKLDRIFDEYYQVGSQGAQRMGVGLGLAIVREVSELLGYSVTVASTVGEGTCVSVRIPRHRLLSGVSAQGREALDDRKMRGFLPGRVVLLEDNDSVRAATELFLTLEGFETRTAGTATQARELFAEMQPGDVLITDYHLDGKTTGVDVLRELRILHGRDVPAIVLTGDLHSVMQLIKTSIPHCRFLSKPIDTKSLLSAIGELTTA